MKTAVLIDDELPNTKNLEVLLSTYCPGIDVVGIGSNADEGLNLILQHRPNIVFLDIQMPDKSGFDMLKSLSSPQFELIFVTAFDSYAIEAIRFSAIDYLLKPINPVELVNAVSRAQVNLKAKVPQEGFSNLMKAIDAIETPRIPISNGKETLFVDGASIIYCEADNNYTKFYLKGKTSVLSTKPIFHYETLLNKVGFLRCHQSFLVNQLYIKKWSKVDGDRLILEEGYNVPIARNRKAQIKDLLFNGKN